jgi:hypothetical protein
MPKQQVAVELFYDGAWHELVSDDDVFADTPIVIMRGNGDESAATRPSSISLRLANDDDKFRTSNPLSPLYGKAGVNTPLRVSVGDAIRGYGEASSWTADQSAGFRRFPRRGKAWVDVQAGGLLQRIGQWTRSVKSPLRLATEDIAGLCGYWPMEDESGSSVATSVVAGTQFATVGGVSFGSQQSPPGGGTAADVGANPSTLFKFQRGDPGSTGGWQLNRVIYLNKLTGGGTADPLFGVQLANGWSVFLQLDGDTSNITLRVSGDGSTILNTSASTSPYNWLGRWIMVQLQTTYAAGITTLAAYWRATDDPDWTVFSGTWSGATSTLDFCGPLLPEGSAFGHLAGTIGTADPLTSGARYEAFQGHNQERASYRFGRLCDENGIPYYVSGGFNESQRMGPQGGDLTLSENFAEIERTEDGIVFDHRSEGRVFFLSQTDRHDQTPKLTLNAAGEDHGMVSLPAEKLDDLPIHNIVTAKQHGGGDFTARDDTSSAGTQDPPAGRGEYKQDVKVNTYAPGAALAQQAHWWLGRGTVDLPRFPKVTINLGALDAARVAEVEQVDVGDVIEIVGYREYTIRLYVVGYTETIGTHSRTIAFTCAPDRQFQVGVLDANRLQASFTIVFPALDATSTTLTLFTGEINEQWRTGSNGVHIELGGEEIVLGTVEARTGTNPYSQTVTGCTRAVNGVQRAHGITELVKVVDPIRLTMGDPS